MCLLKNKKALNVVLRANSFNFINYNIFKTNFTISCIDVFF